MSDPGGAHWLTAHLRALLAHPLARGLDLDSPEATAVHARLIREKAFLRRLYRHYYDDYEAVVGRATPGGVVLEIGSGGGFYREIRPSVVSLDMRPGADVDVVGSALALPFRSESASAVLMLNVLHHLPDPRVFFRECDTGAEARRAGVPDRAVRQPAQSTPDQASASRAVGRAGHVGPGRDRAR